MASIMQQIEDQEMMNVTEQSSSISTLKGTIAGLPRSTSSLGQSFSVTTPPQSLFTRDTSVPITLQHTIHITGSIKQMCKYQDQTYQGNFIDQDTGEEGKWGMVTDGHGSNSCIRFIRSITQDKLNEIISTERPVENLADLINKSGCIAYGESSGATMCLVKIYKNRVVCINCGDSQAAIYRNGNLEFISTLHTSKNPSERSRLDRDFPDIDYVLCSNIQIIAPDSLIGIQTEYTRWTSKLMLACTQALGHRGQTGYAPDTTVIPYGQGESIQVVIGTDGLWDVVLKQNTEEMAELATKTSAELVEFARARWMQEWTQFHSIAEGEEPVFKKCYYQECETDDIGVVKIDISPV